MVYENLWGSVVSGISLTLNYEDEPKTNSTATPEIRNITVRNVKLQADNYYLDCEGLLDSKIEGIVFDNVKVTGSSTQTCSQCSIDSKQTEPRVTCPSAPPQRRRRRRRRKLASPSYLFAT